MDQDTVMALVRHALTVGGTVLVSSGYMNDGQLQTAIGGLVVIVGVGWSIYQKKQQKAALQVAADTGIATPQK